MWVSLGGIVAVTWCLFRIPSNHYGAPWRHAHPPDGPPPQHILDEGLEKEQLKQKLKEVEGFWVETLLERISAAGSSDAGEAAASSGDAVDPLLVACDDQRRVPWGGKKIDWAPTKL